MPADRPHLRAWLPRFGRQEDVQFALEGCTGWRTWWEELDAADTAALRGKKRHAKADKTDTRHRPSPDRGTRSRIMSPEPGRTLRAPR
jgi:hypothetical protein